MKRWIVLVMGIGLVFTAGAVVPPPGQTPAYYYSSFTGLGGYTDPYTQNAASDVSADGATIVGITGDANGVGWGFVWREDQGLGILPCFPDPNPGSAGNGVSADGTMVAGCAAAGSGIEACRWTWAGGQWVPEKLGDLPGGEYFSAAFCMTPAGGVMAGFGQSDLGRVACRWSQKPDDLGNMVWVPEALGDLPGGDYYSEAYGCSDDGTVVVGRSEVGKDGYGWRAFRWTASAGMVDLGVIGKRKWSEAYGCSADGSVVVGATDGDFNRNQVAFRWTSATGMVGLGLLPDTITSAARAVSSNGAIVVGRCSTRKNVNKAFIWDATNGMRLIQDVLIAHGVVLPKNWSLLEAFGVVTPEPGVVVIVGKGKNSQGYSEAWRAVIVGY